MVENCYMLVVEARLKNGTLEQYHRLDEAIKTSQFVRNSCVRYWRSNQGTTRNDLQKLCAVLANNNKKKKSFENILLFFIARTPPTPEHQPTAKH